MRIIFAANIIALLILLLQTAQAAAEGRYQENAKIKNAIKLAGGSVFIGVMGRIVPTELLPFTETADITVGVISLVCANILGLISAKKAFGEVNRKRSGIWTAVLVIMLLAVPSCYAWDVMQIKISEIIEETAPTGGDRFDKPVVYLYNYEGDTQVKLDLKNGSSLTCTYPEYDQETGWTVTAEKDGHLYDDKNNRYRYLYYEGDFGTVSEVKTGTCVKGSDTGKYLEEILKKMGLNDDEAGEFIIYWLPQMEDNPYNVISFDSESFENAVGLNVTPAADEMIRVFMTWYPSDTYVELEEDEIREINTDRNGRTVVEWGGTKTVAPAE